MQPKPVLFYNHAASNYGPPGRVHQHILKAPYEHQSGGEWGNGASALTLALVRLLRFLTVSKVWWERFSWTTKPFGP